MSSGPSRRAQDAKLLDEVSAIDFWLAFHISVAAHLDRARLLVRAGIGRWCAAVLLCCIPASRVVHEQQEQYVPGFEEIAAKEAARLMGQAEHPFQADPA